MQQPGYNMKIFDGDREALEESIRQCSRCGLCRTRHLAVPGEGNMDSRILFVGEGPGQEEDLQGRPFVGPAGQLLDRMLAAVSLDRTGVYIANVVKCRPPGNRNPSEEEAIACLPYLRAQFRMMRPGLVVCLGAISARYLIGSDVRITRDHGKVYERNGTVFLPTYHPSALLRDVSKKRDAWKDWQTLQNIARERDF